MTVRVQMLIIDKFDDSRPLLVQINALMYISRGGGWYFFFIVMILSNH